jgi:3-phenylpropionate/trans-cinnamate dioxygenase ferredoxin reductase subunit
VIVGAGIAEREAAVQLRRAGYTGTISLLGGEPNPPHDRTELAKSFLRIDEPASEIASRRCHSPRRALQDRRPDINSDRAS